MAIKGLDSKVKNAKPCEGLLGLLWVQIIMTEGWIMVRGTYLHQDLLERNVFSHAKEQYEIIDNGKKFINVDYTP